MNSKNWERFTQRARRVLSLAQEEAERLNHSYIGSEHVLIGLLREEGGVAGRAEELLRPGRQGGERAHALSGAG